jgi:hypothetical protein
MKNSMTMRSKKARFGSWGAAVAFLLLVGSLFANTTGEEALENLPAELVGKAKSGDAEAQFEIGKRLDSGQGVEADPKLAADWYRKAALQGHAKAAEYLAIFYEEGIGVKKDLEKAKQWRERAKGTPVPIIAPPLPIEPKGERSIDESIKKLLLEQKQLDEKLEELEKVKERLLEQKMIRATRLKTLQESKLEKDGIKSQHADEPKTQKDDKAVLAEIKRLEKRINELEESIENSRNSFSGNLLDGTPTSLAIDRVIDWQFKRELQDLKTEHLELIAKLAALRKPTRKFVFSPSRHSEIARRYIANKVTLTMTFRHKGGFLGAEKVDTYETETIILVDGTFAYTLVYAKDSPFRLEPLHRKLIEVSGTITTKGNKEPIIVKEIAFMDDPRLLIVPIFVNPRELEEKYDVELFPAKNADDVFHTDALLVGATNYHQANFVNDYGNDKYIRMVGFHSPAGTTKFDPGKDDLVFAKSGEVLGIMVNNDYAYYIQNLGARIQMGTRTPLGKSFDALKTNDLLESLGKSLKSLEQKFR